MLKDNVFYLWCWVLVVVMVYLISITAGYRKCALFVVYLINMTAGALFQRKVMTLFSWWRDNSFEAYQRFKRRLCRCSYRRRTLLSWVTSWNKTRQAWRSKQWQLSPRWQYTADDDWSPLTQHGCVRVAGYLSLSLRTSWKPLHEIIFGLHRNVNGWFTYVIILIKKRIQSRNFQIIVFSKNFVW